jgi:hypothetical protein
MPGAHERGPLARVLGLVVSGPRRSRETAPVPGRTCTPGPKHPGQSPCSSGKQQSHARRRRARTGTAHQAMARRSMSLSLGCLPTEGVRQSARRAGLSEPIYTGMLKLAIHF